MGLVHEYLGTRGKVSKKLKTYSRVKIGVGQSLFDVELK